MDVVLLTLLYEYWLFHFLFKHSLVIVATSWYTSEKRCPVWSVTHDVSDLIPWIYVTSIILDFHRPLYTVGSWLSLFHLTLIVLSVVSVSSSVLSDWVRLDIVTDLIVPQGFSFYYHSDDLWKS